MRRIVLIGAVWVIAVAAMCVIVTRSQPRLMAGPAMMDGQGIDMLGQAAAVILAALTLLLVQSVKRHTGSLYDQINNIHHEGDEPPSMRELIVWTHSDTKETKKLALENRQLIGNVQMEQLRVRDELGDLQARNCPLHDQTAADIAELKRRVGIEDEPT